MNSHRVILSTKQWNNVLLDPHFSLASESIRLVEQPHKLLATLLFISLNIVKRQPTSENTQCNPEGLPTILACQICPCLLPDQQSPTVMHILNEYLQQLQRNNLQSLIARSSQHSLFTDCSQTEAICRTQFVT